MNTNSGTWKVQESNYEGDKWTDTKLPTFATEEEATYAAQVHYLTSAHMNTNHPESAKVACTCEDCSEGFGVLEEYVMLFSCRVVQVCPDCETAVPTDDNGEPIHPDNNCFYATI